MLGYHFTRDTEFLRGLGSNLKCWENVYQRITDICISTSQLSILSNTHSSVTSWYLSTTLEMMLSNGELNLPKTGRPVKKLQHSTLFILYANSLFHHCISVFMPPDYKISQNKYYKPPSFLYSLNSFSDLQVKSSGF